MMINKANNEGEKQIDPVETGYLEVAKLDMQCHLQIKDKDTGEVLVNKRG